MFCFQFQCLNTSAFSCSRTKIDICQVYDAINDDAELPNIDYPDRDSSKAIVEFHACKQLWSIMQDQIFCAFGQYAAIWIYLQTLLFNSNNEFLAASAAVLESIGTFKVNSFN